MIEAFNSINNAVCGFLHINPYIQGVVVLVCINVIAILGMAVLWCASTSSPFSAWRS